MRKLRQTINQVFEASGKYQRAGHILDVILISIIMINVVAIVLESVHSIATEYYSEFLILELVSVAIFSAEYLIRAWTCVDRVKYASMNCSNSQKRIRYILSPLAIIDLIAILPSLLMFFFAIDLRFLRVLRLLRVFKLTRYSRAMQLLLQAFIDESSSLLAAFFIMSVVLILASCGIYLLEHDIQPDKFGSIPAAMWWAMATLTTVGYGDTAPSTVNGRLLFIFYVIPGICVCGAMIGEIGMLIYEQLQRGKVSLV